MEKKRREEEGDRAILLDVAARSDNEDDAIEDLYRQAGPKLPAPSGSRSIRTRKTKADAFQQQVDNIQKAD
jgi:hypothetical protein